MRGAAWMLWSNGAVFRIPSGEAPTVVSSIRSYRLKAEKSAICDMTNLSSKSVENDSLAGLLHLASGSGLAFLLRQENPQSPAESLPPKRSPRSVDLKAVFQLAEFGHCP